MRLALLLGLLVYAGVVAAQPMPGPTRGTEVFTGAADVVQPREKPDKPVTTYWQVHRAVP
jgi:hypothetical protein